MTDDLEKLRELQIVINRRLTVWTVWKRRREAFEKEYRALAHVEGQRAVEERNGSDD
jgi:hypothetical protein